jgi:hypothetical protein
MATALGIWLGLAGAVPVLVGLAGMRRVRRLRRVGVRTWAVAAPRPLDDGVRQVALQYMLPDGRALEKVTAGKVTALLPGERVLIWYDPADPTDVLVHGQPGRVSDLVFVIVGAALVAAGAVIGILTP